MPPKRKITSKSIPSKPPQIINPTNDDESLESELKFDKEVLWCITQFEKLIKAGKINDAKKNESIKVINTLKRSSTPKIQKIQLMKQYFKDYKSKMAKEEELITNEVNFENQDAEISKGVFYKKKIDKDIQQPSSAFLFNFNESSNDDSVKDVIDKIEKL